VTKEEKKGSLIVMILFLGGTLSNFRKISLSKAE
jgi:hypothetical protein